MVTAKTLVAIDIYHIPVEDLEDHRYKKKDYDLSAGISLLPEDAIKLAKDINMLIGEIFNDMNYRGTNVKR